MQKRWFITAFCIVLIQLSAESKKLPSLSILFIQQVNQYVIEPSWAIPSLLAMNVQEFEEAWKFFIKIMIHESQRLIANYEKNYSECNSRGLLIGQCFVYNMLLANLFVNAESGKLLFLLERPIPDGYCSIFDYAKQHNFIIDFYDFYAFYFDRVSANYIESVNNAFLNSDHCDFVQYKQKAQKLLYELYEVFEHLQQSDYEARYGAHMKAYQDIFQRLMAYKSTVDDQ